MYQIYIKFLVILAFLPDWGFIYRGYSKPSISFPEIGVFLLVLMWCFQKITKRNIKIKKNSIKAIFLIIGIFLVATLGATFNYNQIDWFEHIKSSIKLLFWGIFVFCWIDITENLCSNFKLSDRVWKLYINLALLISGMAIFQYIFYQITGLHLKLNPFVQPSWGSMVGNYRAMSIYREPSWLGVILLPSLISQGELFLYSNKFSYLLKFLFLLSGVIISFSLASYLVFGIWGGFVLSKYFIRCFSIFMVPKIKKKKILTIFIIFCLVIISGVIFFYWIYPVVVPRIIIEKNILIFYLKGERQLLTSGVKRFTSYEGFWTILKHSPFFGVGFDQVKYISRLSGKHFEASTSGIFGFIGTSAGLLGILLIFYLFKFIWNGGYKGKIKIENNPKIVLVIAGRAILITLFLEQLFLYAGILNPDFWLPLSFAYLFIISGYKNEKNL